MEKEKINLYDIEGFEEASCSAPRRARESDVVKREDEGTSYYCPECLNYFTAREFDKTCPYCGSENTMPVISHPTYESVQNEMRPQFRRAVDQYVNFMKTENYSDEDLKKDKRKLTGFRSGEKKDMLEKIWSNSMWKREGFMKAIKGFQPWSDEERAYFYAQIESVLSLPHNSRISELENSGNNRESVNLGYTDFNDLLWHGQFTNDGLQAIGRFANTHKKDDIKDLCNALSRYGFENNIYEFGGDEVKSLIHPETGAIKFEVDFGESGKGPIRIHNMGISVSSIKSVLPSAIREARALQQKYGSRIWEGIDTSWGSETGKGKEVKEWFNKYLNKIDPLVFQLNSYAYIKPRSAYIKINREVNFWNELITEMETFPARLDELVNRVKLAGNAKFVSEESASVQNAITDFMTIVQELTKELSGTGWTAWLSPASSSSYPTIWVRSPSGEDFHITSSWIWPRLTVSEIPDGAARYSISEVLRRFGGREY